MVIGYRERKDAKAKGIEMICGKLFKGTTKEMHNDFMRWIQAARGDRDLKPWFEGFFLGVECMVR